jgi:hypothetical protein
MAGLILLEPSGIGRSALLFLLRGLLFIAREQKSVFLVGRTRSGRNEQGFVIREGYIKLSLGDPTETHKGRCVATLREVTTLQELSLIVRVLIDYLIDLVTLIEEKSCVLFQGVSSEIILIKSDVLGLLFLQMRGLLLLPLEMGYGLGCECGFAPVRLEDLKIHCLFPLVRRTETIPALADGAGAIQEERVVGIVRTIEGITGDLRGCAQTEQLASATSEFVNFHEANNFDLGAID